MVTFYVINVEQGCYNAGQIGHLSTFYTELGHDESEVLIPPYSVYTIVDIIEN